MKKSALIISIGFALFSMFFGAGNLVFPIKLGQESAANYPAATLGILLTGVAVPFLGVFGMMLYGGDMRAFFSPLGKTGTFLFSFLAIGLLGPFGVVARCLTVSHGALTLLFPNLSLTLSSFILCLVVYFFAVKKSNIISVLGSFFTPFLLLSIITIAVCGIWQMDAPVQSKINSLDAFKNGIYDGYQTMDLLAGFFFSQFIICQLRQVLKEKGQEGYLTKIFSKAACIGIFLMSSIYLLMVMLGAYYAPLLSDKLPQEMLGAIALAALGNLAAPCVCLAIIFACVTTAIVLSSLFAEFLRVDICRGNIGHSPSLLMTLAIGFAISTLDFGGIAKFLGPLMEMIYPALIVFTAVNVIRGLKSSSKIPLFVNNK